MRLTKALPKQGAPLTIAQPWAIRVSHGLDCVVTTGTSTLLHGVAMRYQCGTMTAGLTRATGNRLMAQVRSMSGSVRQLFVVAIWTS